MISDLEIKKKLWIAINLLFKNDSFLLEESVHERSIAHKLAEYLRQQFPDWHVDCEYNKDGISTKLLPRQCEDTYKKYVYPDIIVHHRNTEDNLVLFEMKTNGSESKLVDKCDNVKLIEFTKINGDFKYQLGIFIGFNGLHKPLIAVYKNGQMK